MDYVVQGARHRRRGSGGLNQVSAARRSRACSWRRVCPGAYAPGWTPTARRGRAMGTRSLGFSRQITVRRSCTIAAQDFDYVRVSAARRSRAGSWRRVCPGAYASGWKPVARRGRAMGTRSLGFSRQITVRRSCTIAAQDFDYVRVSAARRSRACSWWRVCPGAYASAWKPVARRGRAVGTRPVLARSHDRPTRPTGRPPVPLLLVSYRRTMVRSVGLRIGSWRPCGRRHNKLDVRRPGSTGLAGDSRKRGRGCDA
jgi:hypothetical protein